MAKPLTQRALRIFAVLESYRAGSSDILDALLPFFEPILAECPGQPLNTNEFSSRVSETYHWNFTADIVEELIPRFEAKGWVQKIAGTEAAYRISYTNPSAAPNLGPGDIQITETLGALAEEFSDFIESISPLTKFTFDNNNVEASEASDAQLAAGCGRARRMGRTQLVGWVERSETHRYHPT